jgi:hypothetical protein
MFMLAAVSQWHCLQSVAHALNILVELVMPSRLRYVTGSTQQGVGTPSGANERLIEGRALKELIKIN